MLDKWTTKKKVEAHWWRFEEIGESYKLSFFGNSLWLYSWLLQLECSEEVISVRMGSYKKMFLYWVKLLEHRCFQTQLWSVVQNTHVTWSRLTEVLVHFTPVSVGGVPAAYRHRKTDRWVSSIYSYQQRESSTWCCQLIKYLSKNLRSAFKVKIKKS